MTLKKGSLRIYTVKGTKKSIQNPGFIFIFLYFKISVLMTALLLGCCAWALSSCSERGLLSSCGVRASHCSGFSCCDAHALQCGLRSFSTQA